MKAYCKKVNSLYWVYLGQTAVGRPYSAKSNAERHAAAINDAINNPPGLSQHPHRTY